MRLCAGCCNDHSILSEKHKFDVLLVIISGPLRFASILGLGGFGGAEPRRANAGPLFLPSLSPTIFPRSPCQLNTLLPKRPCVRANGMLYRYGPLARLGDDAHPAIKRLHASVYSS